MWPTDLWDGILGGLRGFISTKVDHGPTFGHVIYPEALKELPVVQMEEAASPILHPILPTTFIAVSVACGEVKKKGRGDVVGGEAGTLAFGIQPF